MAGRMVSIFISSVARVRSRPGMAALMAKFMAASRRRPCDAGLDDAVGVAGQRRSGTNAPRHPAEVLAVDAVVVEARRRRCR